MRHDSRHAKTERLYLMKYSEHIRVRTQRNNDHPPRCGERSFLFTGYSNVCICFTKTSILYLHIIQKAFNTRYCILRLFRQKSVVS